MPKLLREVGWLVESDEFAEIEDPDPENHELRQRELINEIEEARKDLEKKAAEKEKKGGKLSWWKKKKAAKNDWEVYDEHSTAIPPSHRQLNQDDDPAKLAENQVMFDIDAIRREVATLAAESKEYNAEAEFEIKEIKSTLPPMKIDIATIPPSQTNAAGNPYATLRETKSYNDSLGSSTLKPATSNGGKYEEYDEFDYDPAGEGQMEMTFDTQFRDDPKPTHQQQQYHSSTSASKSSLPLSPFPAQPSRSGTSSPWEDETSAKWDDDAGAGAYGGGANAGARPPLRSAKTESHTSTMASGGGNNGDMGHNAWADEFEDDFGQEKEVQMSFM